MTGIQEQVRKAGAVILPHDTSDQIALIYRAKEGDWSFPKGHIEDGETPLAACIREIKEETGLAVDMVAQLPDNVYLHRTGKKIITYMFLMRSRGGDLVIEHPDDKIEWVGIHAVEERLAYDNLKLYFKDILPFIKHAT